MRVVILTGRQPHHKHLCAVLAGKHHVVGVIHPKQREPVSSYRKLAETARKYGLAYTLLRLGTRLPPSISGWRIDRETSASESCFFPEAQAAFERLDRGIVFEDVRVDEPSGIDVVRQLDPDVVVNLGGSVYRESFVRACSLMLNYHSGLSPIYNGSGVVGFAFANGHPHLCGGTLMTMSPVVDGGDILAHYLPEIAASDTPATLSMKTYAGAAIVYSRFLSDLREGRRFSRCSQSRPIFNMRGAEWTIYQALRVQRQVERKVAASYIRTERMIDYWRQPDDQSARELFIRTMEGLLWGV